MTYLWQIVSGVCCIFTVIQPDAKEQFMFLSTVTALYSIAAGVQR